MQKTYAVFADYYQFYLWDGTIRPNAPEEYSDADVAARIKAAPNVVVVQPNENSAVNVALEILERAPELDTVNWEHVAEASLDIPTGCLEIHECTGGSIDRIQLEPGPYRVRAHFPSAEGQSAKYKIQIWPAQTSPLVILKQREEENAS